MTGMTVEQASALQQVNDWGGSVRLQSVIKNVLQGHTDKIGQTLFILDPK